MRSRFFEKKRNRCNFSPWGRKCFVCLPPLLVTFLQQHLSLILISCRVAKSRRSIWHRCSTKTEEKTGNLQIHMIYYEICNLIWSLKAFFPLDSFDFFDQWLFTIYIYVYIYIFFLLFSGIAAYDWNSSPPVPKTASFFLVLSIRNDNKWALDMLTYPGKF